LLVAAVREQLAFLLPTRLAVGKHRTRTSR
jgi:hypothetical protein